MSTAEQPDDNLLRRYLLGDRLADGERDRVERSYFESDRHFDRLLEAEDDLIDAYIRDRLSLAERARFERHFLAAKRRRDRYEAMRAIAANFFRERPPRRGSLLESFRSFFVIRTPAARTAAIALGAVSIVLLGSLGAGYVRLKRENTAARALLASSRPVPGRGVPTYTLRPGLLRSGAGDANRLRIEPGSEWLVLRLETPASRDYSVFAAALATAPGEELLRQDRLKSVGNAIELPIPAGVLISGEDYTVALAGLQSDGRRVDLQSYAFHVTN